MEKLSEESSQSSNMELSRRDVFFMVKDSLKNEQKFVIGVLKDAIFKKTEHVIQVDEDEKSLGLLFANFRSRWKAANRGQEKFLKNNEEWLNGTVCFSTLSDTECTTSTSEKIVKNDEKGTSGRPSKSFASSSDRSKRRKTEEIRSTLSTEELTYAAQMSLRTSGQVDAAQVLKDVTLTSPTRASKYIAAVRSKNETPLTPDEALSLMIEKGESKRSYQLSRNAARARKCKLYPSYHEVEKAKNRCYPSVVYMNITESCAQIKLQALLDHTTYRIIQLQADVIDTLNSEILQKLVLHCKWGCDGSSGQSVYKQKFDEAGKSDESIFYTSLVPLQLIYNNHETDEGTIVWKNPRPSSPRFCRPIRLQFVQEDVQSTLKEVTDIEQQIAGLAPYTTEQNEKSISVTYCMSFTMIDGQLSEEAQESRNKDIKNYRLHHSRKCSRESNMRDIFYRLLVSSDPFLSSIRKLPQRPAKSLHKEAIEMLKQPEVTRQEIRNDSDLDTSGSTSESESNDSNIEDDIQDFCY